MVSFDKYSVIESIAYWIRSDSIPSHKLCCWSLHLYVKNKQFSIKFICNLRPIYCTLSIGYIQILTLNIIFVTAYDEDLVPTSRTAVDIRLYTMQPLTAIGDYFAPTTRFANNKQCLFLFQRNSKVAAGIRCVTEHRGQQRFVPTTFSSLVGERRHRQIALIWASNMQREFNGKSMLASYVRGTNCF